MAYEDFKDLGKRTAADKFLRDKAFDIAKDLKYDGYERGLASMVYNFFDKKTKGSGVTTLANKSGIKSTPQNEQNWLKNFINPLLKSLKKEKYMQRSKTMFEVLISRYAINKQI